MQNEKNLKENDIVKEGKKKTLRGKRKRMSSKREEAEK